MSALTPPAIPPWEGMHVLIVHFPVALLTVSPLLILLGQLPRIGRHFAPGAFAVLLLGTVGAYVAVESGEAAAQVATRTPEITAAIHEHAELAETVRLLFTILTTVYALVLVLPPILKRTQLLKWNVPPVVPVVAQGVVLVAALILTLVVANTAHLGGLLVHEYGLHAFLGGP
ncbi:MAG: DUF2231 domain-containing protein [Planctomycetota bacterium]